MRWSWKIGEVAGIGLYVHATFLLLIGWIALSHWVHERSLAGTLTGVGFVLALFGSVVLHELGHALTAKRYGIKTRDITLLPIGGVARLERMPDEPRQELWVALAGPAVNLAIAAGLYAALTLAGVMEPLGRMTLTRGLFLERLMMANLFLLAFNLLPAFPMDGGRVLRALLALRMDYTRATQLAATLGQGIALLFGFIGLFANPFLIFIALFVWVGAAQEAGMVQMVSALGGIPVRRAMLTDFHALSPRDTLARAVELVLSGSQHDFPVVENGTVVGVLARADLLTALAREGPGLPVTAVMRRQFQMADASEMLEVALRRLQADGGGLMPVIHRGQLVGLLTAENVGEFVLVQAALERAGGRRDPQTGVA